MKKISALLLWSLAGLGICVAQSGKVFDELSMHSEILDMDRKYAVYLPPGYEDSERSYPVLYLLHGYGDDQTGWIQFGEVLHITDKAIKAGKATPMVIVMPDANTGPIGYYNSADGKWRYEDFFFEELMPYVEKKYRIKSQKRFRAIAGLSMGGGGTLVYAMHRPELFAAACPLSAWMGALSREAWKGHLDNRGENPSKTELDAHYQRYSVLAYADQADKAALSKVRWYIDCGDDDFLYEGNSLLHIALRKKEVPHEYRVRQGGHTWGYWRSALPTVLEFISVSFHQR